LCFLVPSVFEAAEAVALCFEAAEVVALCFVALMSSLAVDASTGTAVAASIPARIIRFIIVFSPRALMDARSGSPIRMTALVHLRASNQLLSMNDNKLRPPLAVTVPTRSG